MMQAKQQEDIVQRRVGTTVVRNELRLQKWGLGRERSSRVPAHPLAYDERGLPVYQSPLTWAERRMRLVTR
jgi:hypothetical protein